MAQAVDISVIVPLFNEEGTLEELHARLSERLGELGRSYEVLFVDDGSTDGSAATIDRLAERDPHVGVVHFRRNFGKAAALDAGFRRATGRIVFTMDADLQDDPDEIPRFLAKLDEGYDLVNGWKQVRHDPLDKTLPSRLFNWAVSRISGLRLKDFNCGFKAYRAEVLRDLSLYGELHRFIPVLAFWRGFSVAEIPVVHHPRRSGTSKYGVERLFKGFFDLLTVLLNTRYRSRPLHLFGFVGVGFGGIGFLVLAYLALAALFELDPLRLRPLMVFGFFLVMLGLQMLTTGLLAELLTRQGDAAASHYVIREYRPPRHVHPVAHTAAAAEPASQA